MTPGPIRLVPLCIPSISPRYAVTLPPASTTSPRYPPLILPRSTPIVLPPHAVRPCKPALPHSPTVSPVASLGPPCVVAWRAPTSSSATHSHRHVTFVSSPPRISHISPHHLPGSLRLGPNAYVGRALWHVRRFRPRRVEPVESEWHDGPLMMELEMPV